ncbi:MAG: AlwI family type II restriction endonuclease [Prevotellaceae bacterium]|nr:AlwI family type II restriction endonuclease [Prevotellaceae bacterium]
MVDRKQKENLSEGEKVQKRKMRAPEYKPLLYTTTVRNPERYKDFMHILKKFDNQLLTDSTIEAFEREVFKIGLYRPVLYPESVKKKWADTNRGELGDIALTDSETKEIYDLNDPLKNPGIKGHKDAGFNRGWQTRFNTQFLLMKTLGFVYYNMGEKIHFSQTGDKLAQSVEIKIDNGIVSREVVHPEYEQKAFLQAMSRQQRCNPFIRELNDNIPLILLLQVIRLLNADDEYNNCGVSYKELPLFIFWKNNDAALLYERIKQLRKEYKYTPSPEVIQDICINEILGGFKTFKLKSIVSEYPDDYIRKMRMTGLISFRGGGRFIDINHNADEEVDYILKKYATYQKYTDERAYFEYMSKIDTKLFDILAAAISKTDAAEKLKKWISVYDWNTIKKELVNLSKRLPSKDDVLRFLPQPARLEFLTAIAIKSKLPEVVVVPNYSCDDEGLPTSTAGGNKGDIECYEHSNGILVEVTMAEGRTQTMMEIWPIERHLKDFKDTAMLDDAQCMFVAPSIFIDSYNQIGYVKFRYNEIIRPFTIIQFVDYLSTNKQLYRS